MAGHFDKYCASPQSESQDMKAKSAVTCREDQWSAVIVHSRAEESQLWV